jgi:hypothetical protein
MFVNSLPAMTFSTVVSIPSTSPSYEEDHIQASVDRDVPSLHKLNHTPIVTLDVRI